MHEALPIRSTNYDDLPENTLNLVRDLVTQLHAQEICYCHWKSNASLASALAGDGDLDLLIASQSANAFQAIVFELGFKLARQASWAEHPAIYHYFGFDESTGHVVHLHVYYRLVTGGVLLKNTRLPLEQTLLTHTVRFQGVNIASRACELATLVVRKMAEAASPLELLLLLKDWGHVRSEVNWLLPQNGPECERVISESYSLLKKAIPTIDPHQYRTAVEMLRGDTSALKIYCIARKFTASIRHLTLHRRPTAVWLSFYRGARRFSHRLANQKQPAKRLLTVGKVIAIVGPEASGKSTLTSDVTAWLKHAYNTYLVHTGKPKSNILTTIPNHAVKAVRKFWRREHFPKQGLGSQERVSSPSSTALLWLYSLRSLWLAYDRKRIVVKAHRMAAQGGILICDRYPTPTIGAMDSPRLDESNPHIRHSRILSWLARHERRLYETMPRADLVLRLDVSLEVALHRNRERIKLDKEGDDFVELRHALWQKHIFPCDDVVTINTGLPINEVIRTVRQEIWKRL